MCTLNLNIKKQIFLSYLQIINVDHYHSWTKGSQYHKSQFAHCFWIILLANSSAWAQKTKQIASVYARKRLESASEQYNGKKFNLVQKIYNGIF